MACDLGLAINVFRNCNDSRSSSAQCFELSPIPVTETSPFKICQPDWCCKPTTCSYKLEEISTGAIFDLGQAPIVTIGRNSNSTVMLANLSVSRLHAAILFGSCDLAYLVDLGSSHGTYICNQKLKPYTPTLLTKKSLIRFGAYGDQYLLRSTLSSSCIAEEARRIACEEERNVYLNTQNNLFNLAARSDLGSSLSSGVNQQQQRPALAALETLKNISRSSADEDISRIDTLDFFPRERSGGFDASKINPNINPFSPRITLVEDRERQNSLSSDYAQSPDQQPKVSISPCLFNLSRSRLNSFPSEGCIKRCASAAGVDECDEFDLSPDLASSPPLQRQKLDSISSSMDDAAGFYYGSGNMQRSNSMSECDDDDSGSGFLVLPSQRLKKKVKFIDEPKLTVFDDGDY